MTKQKEGQSNMVYVIKVILNIGIFVVVAWSLVYLTDLVASHEQTPIPDILIPLWIIGCVGIMIKSLGIK